MLLKILRKSRIYLFLYGSLVSIGGQTMNLDISSAMVLATESAIELEIQRSQLNLGVQKYRLDFRQFFPNLKIDYRDSRKVQNQGRDSYSKEISLGVQQLIFDGARTWKKWRLSRAKLLIDQQDYLLKVEKLNDKVWELYYDIILTKQKLDLQKRSLKISQKQLEIFKLKEAQGLLTPLDIVEAELQFSNFELSYQKSQIDLKNKRFQFSLLLGLPLELSLILTEEDFIAYEGTIKVHLLETLFNSALENNLDLLKISYQIMKKKEEKGIAHSRFIPDIYMRVDYSISGDEFPLYKDIFSIGLSFSMSQINSPLFGSFTQRYPNEFSKSRSTNIGVEPFKSLGTGLSSKAIDIELKGLLEQEKKIKETLYLALKNYLNSYELMAKQLLFEQKNILLTQKKIKILQKEFSLGRLRAKDLFSAQIELYEKEIDSLYKILELKKLEWKIEKNTGLPPGMFILLGESINES